MEMSVFAMKPTVFNEKNEINNLKFEIENRKLPIPLPTQPEEDRILSAFERPDIIDWARENFILPKKFSRIHGKWSDEYTPFLREPLRWLTKTPVELFIEACTQGGKTTAILILLHYIFENCPDPTILCMPQEKAMRRRVRTRIRPMFEANPELFRRIKNDVRNINIGSETDLGDMLLYLAWATSGVTMDDNPACTIILDEVATMAFNTDTASTDNTDEGDDSTISPIDRLRDRQRTYQSGGLSRLVGVSSPELAGDMFDLEMRDGTDERWHVPCPICGRWHKMSMDYIELDKNKDGTFLAAETYRKPGKSRYVCPLCQAAWTEVDRAAANEPGIWVPKTQRMDPNGKVTGDLGSVFKRSIRITAMMLHPAIHPITAIAAKFAKAQNELKKGNKRPLRRYQNRERAEPWRVVVKAIDSDVLRTQLSGLPARAIPADAELLVAGADYHETEDGDVRIDFEVRAFGNDYRNWVVLAGTVASFKQLEVKLKFAFPWADDGIDEPELAVACVFIDSNFKAETVYQWCRKFPTWAKPCRGVDSQMKPVKPSSLAEVVARSRNKSRARRSRQYQGMELMNIHAPHFSDQITDWGERSDPAAECTLFYDSIERDTDGRYFEEFCGMRRVSQVSRGRRRWMWVAKTDSTPVHFHDCGKYAAAAAHHKGAHQLFTPEALDQLPEALRRRMIRKKTKLSEKPRRRR